MPRPNLKPQTLLETPQDRVNHLRNTNLTFFWKPYPWQERLLETIRAKITTGAISSNKIGKTAAGANIVISWALGYEPWTQTKDPNAYQDSVHIVSKGIDLYYRKSSLGIEPPVNIIITGEDWKLHLGKTIVPELKKWAPQGFYQTHKNEQGVDFFWEWENKSTFTLMSYTQDVDLFESFRAQAAWEDEPPPKDRHTALSRGLLLDNGKTLMTLTPLKEPWVLDDIVLSGRKDIGIVDGLMITDNPDLLKSDMGVLDSMGLDKEQKQQYFDLLLYEDKEKGKPVSDKGRAAEEYLEKVAPVQKHGNIMLLKILKFVKDIDPSDVPSRLFGQFKSLVGRILKEFDKDIHLKKFPEKGIPPHWPVTAMIDWHLSTPQAISYWAVDERNCHYLVGETWDNISTEAIGYDIIRKMRGYCWRIEDAYIDPLAKGDIAYRRNEAGDDTDDAFTKLEKILRKEGIRLHVASKDKESGIMNIKTWLKGPNEMPSCYLYEPCPQHIYEAARWIYDDDGKPCKDCSDHFMENWYRYTLTGAKYTDRRQDDKNFKSDYQFDPFTYDQPVISQIEFNVWG